MARFAHVARASDPSIQMELAGRELLPDQPPSWRALRCPSTRAGQGAPSRKELVRPAGLGQRLGGAGGKCHTQADREPTSRPLDPQLAVMSNCGLMRDC